MHEHKTCSCSALLAGTRLSLCSLCSARSAETLLMQDTACRRAGNTPAVLQFLSTERMCRVMLSTMPTWEVCPHWVWMSSPSCNQAHSIPRTALLRSASRVPVMCARATCGARVAGWVIQCPQPVSIPPCTYAKCNPQMVWLVLRIISCTHGTLVMSRYARKCFDDGGK